MIDITLNLSNETAKEINNYAYRKVNTVSNIINPLVIVKNILVIFNILQLFYICYTVITLKEIDKKEMFFIFILIMQSFYTTIFLMLYENNFYKHIYFILIPLIFPIFISKIIHHFKNIDTV